ncbi:conserved membrane hypothetical protein [Gammaproteobacteria bacterium]
MSETVIQNTFWSLLISTVVILPTFVSAGIVFQSFFKKSKESEIGRASVLVSIIVLFYLLLADLLALVLGTPGQVSLGVWFSSDDLKFPIVFSLCPASLAMATGVAFLGWVTTSFSVSYLHREENFYRFFLALGLFLSGMYLIVLGGSGFIVFIGWELCGVSSYLLIGYAYTRPSATENALFAFVANRIGEAGFLLGLIIALLTIGDTSWDSLASWAEGTSFDKVTARLMLFGFVIAALAKSAQFPFSPWIARALEGPTPSSAIFYGSVMVHAGVWLVIRLEPVFLQVPDTLYWLLGAGFLTILYGAVSGLVQTDVKSALMFSTTTQVGLLFLECGMGWFSLATWHLGLHAMARAWQFLTAPSYLQYHENRKEPRSITAFFPLVFWTAALQRFWLDSLVLSLFAKPFVSIGEDLQSLDDRVLSKMIGMPSESNSTEDLVIRAYGLGGNVLSWIADLLQSFETRLILGDNSWTARAHQEIGAVFQTVEALLEQPRYLLLILIMTFAIIL